MTNLEQHDQSIKWIISSVLLALFLGALDSLIMSAAMPTIIADLGGLHLYAWVYSAYFLARAVALPIYGKLADIYPVRILLLIAILLFVSSSIVAGLAQSMICLIMARVVQGLGCGGIFALVYVVLSDVSSPDQRAKTFSFASIVWGIASLIGPSLGGALVTWLSWRWIFFINIPLGLLSLYGIGRYFQESRVKETEKDIDILGAALFSTCILGFLLLIMTGGRELPSTSPAFLIVILISIAAGLLFFLVERKAEAPIIEFQFFRRPPYVLGNTLVFLSSFAIFSLFAYAPILLQGALSYTPLQIGYVMLSISLGWSGGSFVAGRTMNRFGRKHITLAGASLLVLGAGMTLLFSMQSGFAQCFLTFLVMGIGMGWVSLSTLLVVQDSVDSADLGVATSFHQFSRTIGGTIGVGFCGGIVTDKLISDLRAVEQDLPEAVIRMLKDSMANLFQQDFLAMVPDALEVILQGAVFNSVYLAFIIVFVVAILSLVLTLLLPEK